MTREEHYDKIRNLALKSNKLLLKLPTSFGKSLVSLDIAKLWHDKADKINSSFSDPEENGRLSVLIVIPKLVMIKNWKFEITKWYPNWQQWLAVTFVTYVSFPKVVINYDLIILDECHHFTERCADSVFENNHTKCAVIAMSGTVPYAIRGRLYDTFNGMLSYSVSVKEATNDNIIPDPTVFLVPLTLDDKTISYLYVKNPKGKGEAVVNYPDRFGYIKRKDIKVTVRCTEFQYYSLLQQDIDFWDNFFKKTQQPWAKNKWLHLCGERLKWLASIKTPLIQGIQSMIKNKRYITFCSNIEQAKKLGEYCIHSKDKDTYKYLDMFNNGQVSNVAAVNVLNEGLNVTSCQIGVFAGLNSSEIITKQRLGRILRHRKPLIILPYYVCTRDEEIVQKMSEDYNPELVKVVPLKDLENEFKTFQNE